MNSIEKLNSKFEKQLHICVGLDTDINKIPKHLLKSDDPVFDFNKQIIEATHDLANSYKINLAFYEADGLKGLESLQKTLDIIPKDVFVIGDAKRGDIGNTSQMYAESIYNHFGFDSITIHPYMGTDSVSPFLAFKDKLNFILALTSNPGANDFEKLKLEDGRFLFQAVIEKVKNWNSANNCGIVFGATNSDELRDNMKLIDNLPILLPGIGAQGGSLEEVVKILSENNHKSFIINVSRALIYADQSEKFSETGREVLKDYNTKIIDILNS